MAEGYYRVNPIISEQTRPPNSQVQHHTMSGMDAPPVCEPLAHSSTPTGSENDSKYAPGNKNCVDESPQASLHPQPQPQPPLYSYCGCCWYPVQPGHWYTPYWPHWVYAYPYHPWCYVPAGSWYYYSVACSCEACTQPQQATDSKQHGDGVPLQPYDKASSSLQSQNGSVLSNEQPFFNKANVQPVPSTTAIPVQSTLTETNVLQIGSNVEIADGLSFSAIGQQASKEASPNTAQLQESFADSKHVQTPEGATGINVLNNTQHQTDTCKTLSPNDTSEVHSGRLKLETNYARGLIDTEPPVTVKFFGRKPKFKFRLNKRKKVQHSLIQASYKSVGVSRRIPLLLRVCVAMIALLLLLAGDVERNPGPTAVTIDQVHEIAALIAEVVGDWDLFLGQLKVSIGKLEQLREENAGRPSAAQRCLIAGLCHWVTSDENPTYEKIIAVFNGDFLTNKPLARKVTLYVDNLKGSEENSSSGAEVSPQSAAKQHVYVLPKYCKFIKSVYESHNSLAMEVEWPPPPTRKVFNLSMIGREAMNYHRGNDEMIRLLMVHGEVSKVMQQRKSVDLKDLFHLDTHKRKIILIEGAPGAGKSTLAWHICQKWKAGELFQEFKLVVFLQLRDPDIQRAKTLSDVLLWDRDTKMKQVIADIKDLNGKSVLFVLDGWDEFAPGIKPKGFIKELICSPGQHRLNGCTLVITSRSISSGNLHQHCSSRVEILGFSQSERKQYFADSLSNDANATQKFEVCLRNRPVIEASCYLPLNAAIVVHLFLAGNHALPSTLHGVFLQLVINCIVRHMMREGEEPPRISSLDELPPDMQTELSHICAMAYHGVMEDKVTFSEDDLKSFNLPSDLSTLSLIRGVQTLMRTYKLRLYNFLHLSVQELLTSYRISKLPLQEQVKIFKKLFGKPRFAAVFQFYAAFTKLQAPGIRQIVAQMILKKNLLFTLLHCIYEAQDSSLCEFVTSKLEGRLDLSFKALSPIDALAVGYFLNQCATICPIAANLSGCSLDTYSLELMGAELNKLIQNHEIRHKIQLNLTGCKMDGYHIQYIAAHLFGDVITKLDLSGNPIQDNEDGLSHLCQALKANTYMKELTLCGFTLRVSGTRQGEMADAINHLDLSNRSITGHSLVLICTLISSSSAISKLDISGNPIQKGKDGFSHLCQALTTNKSLIDLNLSNCSITITTENGQTLSHMLKVNKTLKLLQISPLVNTNGQGVRSLSNAISSSSVISKLDLSGNPIEEGEDGLSYLCQALTINTSIVELNLSNCRLGITAENDPALNTLESLPTSSAAQKPNLQGTYCLSEKAMSSSAISKLYLSGKSVEDRLLQLWQALAVNKSILVLNMSNCKLRITAENGSALCYMLRKNSTLNVFILSSTTMNGVGVRYLSEGISSSSAISKLDLSDNPIQDSEDGLSHLCQALTTNNSVAELNLNKCKLRITQKNGEALSHMLKENSFLNTLVLSNTTINGVGICYLSEGITSSVIKKLDLSGNPIQDGEDGLFHLCKALTNNKFVVEMDLSNCCVSITKENGQALRNMLRNNSTLNTLILMNTTMNGVGVRYLSEGIHSSSAISKLDLSGCPIQDGEDGLSHLCQALTMNISLVELKLSGFTLHLSGMTNGTMFEAIKSLNLSNQNITGPVIFSMSKFISSSSAIRKLDLSGNPIQDGEDGLSHLCQALATNTSLVQLNLGIFTLCVSGKQCGEMAEAIKALNLSHKNITGPVVVSISRFICSSSAISKLDLSDNPIQVGEDGFFHLCQALRSNTSLVELNLSNSRLKITEKNGQELVFMLRENNSLKTLQISPIQETTGQGVRFLSEAINSSSAISKLDLSGNFIQVDEDGLSLLCKALWSNTSLLELNLSNCRLTITEQNSQALSRMFKNNNHLKRLILANTGMNGISVRQLAKGITSSSAMRRLDLSSNPIQDGEDGLSHLCQALINTTLVELKFYDLTLCVSGEQCGEMAKAIKYLNLSNKCITGPKVQSMLELFSTSSAISMLNLSGNPIQASEDGLFHLCQALTTNTSILNLNLSNCRLKITKENGLALTQMLKGNKTLNTLVLSNTTMNGVGMRYLSEGICSSSVISKLNVSHNPIQDDEDGLSHLYQALTTNTSLIELTLCGFTLRLSGTRQGEMADAIKHMNLANKNITGHCLFLMSPLISSSSAISKLDLSGNPIQDGEDGLSHLCQALTTNTSIVELKLCDFVLCVSGTRQGEMADAVKYMNLANHIITGYCLFLMSPLISSSSAINELDLSGNPIQDDEDGLSHLCQAMTINTSLVELNLSNCRLKITKENGQALSHMLKTNGVLKSLEISPIVDTNGCGIRYLSEGISSSSAISKLDLSGNPIQDGEDGLSHLCQALTTNKSILVVNLSNCRLSITKENSGALIRMMKSNKTLESLIFSNASINGSGVYYLAKGITSSSAISKLDLSDNPIQDGEDGLSHLCRALAINTSLVELNLSNCRLKITKKNGQALSHMLKRNGILKSLEISPIVDTNGCGIRYLSEAISSSSAISKLDLSGNPIQDDEDGFSHLCQALTINTSLVELNLSNCRLKITKENGQALSHVLKTNGILKSLEISPIVDTNGCGIRYLSEGISSSSAISKLDLSGNPIQDGEDGLSHLCQALAINTSLVELNLSNCGLKKCGSSLEELLMKNKTLEYLKLSWNPNIALDVDQIMSSMRKNSTLKRMDLLWCNIRNTSRLDQRCRCHF